MKLVNMTGRTGREVPNQFIIFTPAATYFQSYQTVICKSYFVDGIKKYFLDKDAWNYSRTTAKYRNMFLGKTTKEIKNEINSGVIELVDLNKEAVIQ